jgi:hypothetical protein
MMPAAAVSPTTVVMVMPAAAISPAAVVMRMPVMPTSAPAMVPAPTATVIVRVEVTIAVSWAVPAMAPSVTDVIGLYHVGSLRGFGSVRGLAWNGDRHRRRGRGRECNTAERGETNKCRNKFHDIHLLTHVGGAPGATGSAHYRGLISMNKCGSEGFPISKTFQSQRLSNS